MKFKDLLAKEGFLPVALPADDYQVQQILIKDDKKVLKHLPDKVFKLFKQGENASLPMPKENITITGFSGTAATHAEAGISIGFLDKLVKKIGVSLGFKLETSADEEIVFLFESPLKDEISSFIDLDAYLNDSSVIEGTFGNMLKSDDIFIITAVLKSSKFAFGIVDKSKLSSSLDLPSIKDFVEGKFTLSKDGSTKRAYQYDGEKPLIFAVQAVQVQYDRSLGQWLFGRKGVFRTINTKGVIVRDDEDIKVSLLDGDVIKLG
jgi:hypothetical protein